MHPAAVAKPELGAATPRLARPTAEPPPIMRLALFQPDIPQNAGALIRLGACLGVPVDIIEPCGFVLSDRRLRRAGMDYLGAAETTRHESWAAFRAACAARLIIPMRPGLRSLNVALAAAMVLGEALRQTGGFPGDRAGDQE